MYNNSYFGNSGYANQMYSSYPQNYASYQQPQMAQRQMPVQQQAYAPQDIPFNDVKFVTADEAKAYIVMPNTKVMLMDRDKSIFYIKSADAMGKSSIEGFKYSKLEESPDKPVSAEIDTKEFVKSSELTNFIQKDDLKGFIRREDLANFITKDEIKSLDAKLDYIQKQIRINDILKGEQPNGN